MMNIFIITTAATTTTAAKYVNSYQSSQYGIDLTCDVIYRAGQILTADKTTD